MVVSSVEDLRDEMMRDVQMQVQDCYAVVIGSNCNA
jgi:hypothetical protein